MSEFLSDCGENEIVDGLLQILGGPLNQQRSDVLVGPGDDCAVIAGTTDREDILLKADSVIEGVHYQPDEKPELVGEKALKRAISDIAAMGGNPTHAVVSVACSGEVPVAYLRAVYHGLVQTSERFDLAIVGGDTAGLPDRSPAVFSVSLLGRVPAGEAVLRSGAQPGDQLYVTGRLGGSLPSRRHLSFEPRIEEGIWLREQGVSAMMDLSDGLGKDLPRLATASGCGFVIDQSLLPLHPGCSPKNAICDGEDYELLVASATQLPATCPGGLSLTRIGAIVSEGEGQAVEGGWEYFTNQGSVCRDA